MCNQSLTKLYSPLVGLNLRSGVDKNVTWILPFSHQSIVFVMAGRIFFRYQIGTAQVCVSSSCPKLLCLSFTFEMFSAARIFLKRSREMQVS